MNLTKVEEAIRATTATRNLPRSTCPHCEHNGPIETDFGWRTMAGGIIRPQSWCRECRAAGGKIKRGNS